jgi:Tol biopolymer transport system component
VLVEPAQAVALVRDLIDRVGRGELRGVPSVTVLRFSADGVTIEGPVEAGGRAVALAAQLLDALLTDAERPHELRVPGALRLALARATGTLDLPAYGTLDAFADALARFAAPETADEIGRALAEKCSVAEPAGETEPAAPVFATDGGDAPDRGALVPSRSSTALAVFPALTISDIRRARRATGLRLGDVAEMSGLPISWLRELEWGDLRNWPGGAEGRALILRYARAAGLDEQIVSATAWPLLLERGGPPGQPPTVIDMPVAAPPPLDPPPPGAETSAGNALPGRRRARVMAAAVAVLTIASAAAVATLRRPSPAPPATIAMPQPVATAEAPRPSPATAPPARMSPVPQRAAPPAEPRRSPIGKSATRSGAQPAKGLPGNATAYSPTFASAGSAMFYHAQSNGRSALMRADTDARGSILQITSIVQDRGHNFHARPSPDGTKIAFDSDRDGERGVYVADADGRHARRVTGSGFAAIPSWAPNGRVLAVARAESGRSRVWNLWTVDLSTGRMRRLTNYPSGQLWGGSWFPDGHRIAYSHEDRLYVLDIRTGAARAYQTPVKGRLVRTPAVSPNGRRIIFQVFRDGAWILDLAANSMRKVLWDPFAEEYAWSPDGRRVAFHSRRSGSWSIWTMGAD